MTRRFIRKGDKTDRNGVVKDGIGNSSVAPFSPASPAI